MRNFLENDPAGPITGADSFPGIQAGADVLFSMAALLTAAWSRADHIGTQPQSSVDGLVAALSAKAADADVVKLTGNQTVAGVKTFASAPVVPASSWTIAKTAGLQAALDAIPVDGSLVHDTGNETIAGIKTFLSSPVVPTPATGTAAANRDYVDTAITGGSGVRVEDQGSTVVAIASGLNFAGSGVVVTDAGSGEALVTVVGATSYGVRVEDQPTWDPIAADNDAAFASALAAAVAAGNDQVLLPRLLKIGNTNHLVTPPCGLVGMGGGFVGAASTILCTHANSRVSFGDQTTARFGGVSQGFFIDGDDIATQPLYIGIVSSPVFIGVDVARSTATGINLLLEGTQNGFIHINSYNGGTLCKIDRGAFTNYFPKVEFSESAKYHVHFGANAGGAPLSGIAYTGHNVFDTAIFERSSVGITAAVLHEAGFHNELRHCVLAGEDFPVFIQVTKPTASQSARFHLNGVSIEGQDSPVSANGIDIAAGCSVDFEQYLSLSGLVNGITFADTAIIEETVSPTFATVTNEYVGTPAYRDVVFRQARRNGITYTGDLVTSYPIDVRVDGDVRERLRIYANGDVYRGNGAVAPVKILGAQGAAVADAAGGVVIDIEARAAINGLLAQLRAATGHGLIA